MTGPTPTRIERWIPAWGWIRRYRRADLPGDLTAGVVVAVMLVPQGMAYAMLAGMPPVAGLYASAVPVLAYVLFGSSRQLAVGPSALTSLLTLAAVARLAPTGTGEYIALAALLAIMAGLLQVVLGLARFGFVTNFLSRAVISGFTSAAALIIAVNQLTYLLGIRVDAGEGLVGLLAGIGAALPRTHALTLAIGAGSVVVLFALKRLGIRALPGPLVVVVLGTVLVGLGGLEARGVAVVGPVPGGLPRPALPPLDPATILSLVPAALAIAFVGFMESIAVARSIAARENYAVDANRELVGLGLAGIVSGLVRGYPIGGGFGRSAVNYQSGARTQLASVVRAALLIATLLLLTPLFTHLPRAVLGAIVFVAVLGLIDLREPLLLFRVRPTDGITLVLTALVTLFVGIEAGILSGVAFSLLVFIFRSAYPHVAEVGWLAPEGVYRNLERFDRARRYRGVVIARPDASLYFANMAFLQSWLERAVAARGAASSEPVRAVVLDCSAVNDVDAVAIHTLERLMVEWGGQGIALHLAGVKGPVRDLLERAGTRARHADRVQHLSVPHALEAIGAVLEPEGAAGAAADPHPEPAAGAHGAESAEPGATAAAESHAAPRGSHAERAESHAAPADPHPEPAADPASARARPAGPPETPTGGTA